MVFKDDYQNKAFQFQLTPGDGLHVPVTYPHHVRVGSSFSISFSITFRTPDLDRRAIVYDMNGKLRQRGYHPLPYGQSALRDTVKYQAARVWRRAHRQVEPSHDH
jgi:ribosomal protein L16 Arg81 hydroxylase